MMLRYCRDKREIRSGIKWRIDIDEIYLARKLRQQRRQHILLIAPDQPVAPFRLPPRRKQLQGPLPVGRALIHRLNRLKRQRNPHRRLLLSINILPIPDEFRHPCALKNLGKRMVSLADGTAFWKRVSSAFSVL